MPVPTIAPTRGAATPNLRAEALAPVVGADLEVPLVGGGRTRYVNLDYAASAPCLTAVRDTLERVMPWYASVHRGAGFASTVCTELLDDARRIIHRFVGGRPDDTVILTRNTTDALNLLASVVPTNVGVISFASEHHANLLPWRRHPGSVLLPVPQSPDAALEAVDRALRAAPAGSLVAVTGASNVTGELWPLADLARLVRVHGGRLAVDAAQLAPHRPIDLAADGIDWVALSGHKLYAPFGCGVLVGRPDWLDQGLPYLAGGGAVRHVSVETTDWAHGPARHEGGTPNVLGPVALAAAAAELSRIGFDAIATHEEDLTSRLHRHLAAVPGVDSYRLWEQADTIGVTSFNLDGWHHALLAAVLSAEHGIGVRDGAFCAHPLTRQLVGDRPVQVDGQVGAGAPGAVRVSIGLGTSADDIDRLGCALAAIAASGPRVAYRMQDGRFQPAHDDRRRPSLLPHVGGGGSTDRAPDRNGWAPSPQRDAGCRA